MSRHIIQDLFTIQGIHLIGGPSGVGKTRWLLKMLESWQRGEPVFGHASFPLPFVYIAADRGRRDAYATLYAMNLDAKNWPLIAHDDVPQIENAKQIILRALKYFPQAKVIVVEGLASLMPGGGDKVNSNGAVQKFLKELAQFNKQRDTTIIGTVHTTKRKKDEGYTLSREKIMGASAWGGYSNTIITIDPVDEKDPTSPERTITLMPRNAPIEKYSLAFNEKGLLVKVDGPVERQKTSERAMLAFLGTRKGDLQKFTRQDVISSFASHKPPLARESAKRAIDSAIEEGLVIRLKPGVFKARELDVLDLRPEDPDTGG